MKKKIKYVIAFILCFFTNLFIANAFSFTYYECNKYTVTKGEYIKTVSYFEFKELYRDDLLLCPDSTYETANYPEQEKCYIKNDSKYDIYNVSYERKTFYRPDNAETLGNYYCQDGKKHIYSCEAANNNHELCSLMSDKCLWSNNSCSLKQSSNNTTRQTTKQNNTQVTTTVATNCQGVFNGFEDDLYSIFNAFRIIAPLIVAGFSVYEYLLAVLNKDADALKKCNSKLIKRLIIMAVLFLLPSVVNLFLKLIGDKYGVCVNIK